MNSLCNCRKTSQKTHEPVSITPHLLPALVRGAVQPHLPVHQRRQRHHLVRVRAGADDRLHGQGHGHHGGRRGKLPRAGVGRGLGGGRRGCRIPGRCRCRCRGGHLFRQEAGDGLGGLCGDLHLAPAHRRVVHLRWLQSCWLVVFWWGGGEGTAQEHVTAISAVAPRLSHSKRR